MKTLEPLIDTLKQVKDELEKAIKPGPTLDYSQINKKPDRAAQEAAAPTLDYSNRMSGPKAISALDRANAVRAKLNAESNETALETIKRRQAMNKDETNMSQEGAANQTGAGDDMAMSEKEPHKDDPQHEAKEVKLANKVKEEAQDLIDMHKGADCMVKAHSNGQWYLEKKHIGFDKLQHKLEGEGHSAESAGNIAAAIGRKKYGAKKMAEMAHKTEESEDK